MHITLEIPDMLHIGLKSSQVISVVFFTLKTAIHHTGYKSVLTVQWVEIIPFDCY